MEKESPTQVKQGEYPVTIYEGERLLIKCSSLQEAARFIKERTNDKFFRWTPINKSLWYDEPYSIGGATFHFVTDPKIKKEKLKELSEKKFKN
ncbi:hypothetical protein SAMN04487936_102147 [Halobacillus dabanensis]|uniref:Uncharacterized protein n=2 Tax=Halobacillus dabanensis TaxID=240302 RepID=A0A1I3RD54_HALDA|nr:hypothetical protein SAMN04487936_102147 [Halobacillus dabanensis]